jgi:hypothetical protein
MEAVYFPETSVDNISRVRRFTVCGSLKPGVLKEYSYSTLTSLLYKCRNLNTEKLDRHVIGF